MKKPTIILDMDGVIHSYASGWQGVGNLPDPPVEGTAKAIAKLRTKYNVVVFSTRSACHDGLKAIRDYLAKHEIEVDQVVDRKVPAVAMVDDRGIRFGGNWNSTVGVLMDDRMLIPWNKPGAASPKDRWLRSEISKLSFDGFNEPVDPRIGTPTRAVVGESCLVTDEAAIRAMVAAAPDLVGLMRTTYHPDDFVALHFQVKHARVEVGISTEGDIRCALVASGYVASVDKEWAGGPHSPSDALA